MLIIGLGEAGCNIATLFKQHKQYEVVLLDEGKGIKKQKTVEDYDSIDYKPRRKAIKSATEGILFVCGSGKIAGASLRVLEALKDYKTTVVYIVPDLEFASEKQRKRHKVHFGILQEYTRSGMVNEMIILDNKTLFSIAGAGTALKYYEKVNYFIYSTFQNLLYCMHVNPDFGRLHDKKEVSRISTIGMAKFREEEKLLFSLDNITETCYLINIDEEDLNNDEDIIPSCQQIIRDNMALERQSSFAIWKSSEENHLYSIHYTHFIQE